MTDDEARIKARYPKRSALDYVLGIGALVAVVGAIAMVLMALFSLVLAAAGSAPTGGLGVDRLSVIVASLTSLAVYLVPLVALLMSFDAIAGEVERGITA